MTKILTISKQPLSGLARSLPWLLIVCGLVGVIASVVITQDKFELAQNANFQPACDLNPIISCGSVMKSWQAHAFGFMNTYIGLLGFPILITTGMAMLAGAKSKRWYWAGMQIGLTLGTAFAYWLLWQSMYRINALCPWCLSVDVTITVVWWYLTLHNFREGNVRLPARFAREPRLGALGRFVQRHHADIIVFWFVAVIALILQHFWYYFGSKL